jgi:hypothetical protein
MGEPLPSPATPADGTRKRFSLRPWLRALHRDLGYLAVGLTFVYALSGLAVNHVADWDPSFASYERTYELGGALVAESDEALARTVARRVGAEGEPREVYRLGDDALEIVWDRRTLHVDTATGRVVEEGHEARFFLRIANWLHLNRGKKGWTRFADAYAAGLLVLATSGLFMIPGRKGLFGRGAVLLAIGVAIPLAYLRWSGGP